MLDFPASPINGQTFAASNGVNYVYQLPPGQWVDASPSSGGGGVEYLPVLVGTPAQNTSAIQNALDRLAARGGGILQFSAGVAYYTAAPDTQVAPDEGMAWLLTAAHSNIVIRGAGKGVTILKPASNKVESFVQHGASNLRFEGLTFDNSANGLLQHFTIPAVPVPGGGVAGLGNQTNAAINQYTGADTTIIDCEFIQFQDALRYSGNYLDNQQLVGDIVVKGCRYDGCVVGILCSQPRTILFTDSDFSNGVGSIIADGTTAPGHGIYVTDRSGAYPELITISNITGKNNQDTNLRVRKGMSVSVTNCPLIDAVRGHNFENCRSLTVSNCAIRMKNVPEDNSAPGLFITDCGYYTISNCVIDCSGTDAYAMRIVTSGSSLAAWSNANGVIENISIFNDLSMTTDSHPWCAIIGQTDLTMRNITGFVLGNVAHNRRMIELVQCTRTHIVRPSKRSAAAGNPIGSDLMVTIRSDCTDCTVEWSQYDVDLVSINNVTNASATTRIAQISGGAISGTWTPVPSFATPGDFVPTIGRAEGAWTRIGNFVWASCLLEFACNAYTTVAGAFQITGLPFPMRASGGMHRHTSALGTHTQLNVISPTDIGVWIDNGAQYFTLRQSTVNSAGASLTGANLPASRTGIGLYFTIMYETEAA